jgi:hypothetical protein
MVSWLAVMETVLNVVFSVMERRIALMDQMKIHVVSFKIHIIRLKRAKIS